MTERSWILGDGPATAGWPGVAALAPGVFAALDGLELEFARVVPADVLDLCRAQMARILVGAYGGTSSATHGPTVATTEQQSAALDVAEQFAVDVTGMTDQIVDRLEQYFTREEAVTLVASLWFEEAMIRLGMVLGVERPRAGTMPGLAAQAPAVGPDVAAAVAVDPIAAIAPTLINARAVLLESLAALNGIDPQTAELTRLLNANLQQCRVCLSFRYTDGDEDVLDDVTEYEQSTVITERQKRALRLCDVYLRAPGQPKQKLMADLLEEFSAEQILELLLRQVRYTWNKALVTLRLDAVRA